MKRKAISQSLCACLYLAAHPPTIHLKGGRLKSGTVRRLSHSHPRTSSDRAFAHAPRRRLARVSTPDRRNEHHVVHCYYHCPHPCRNATLQLCCQEEAAVVSTTSSLSCREHPTDTGIVVHFHTIMTADGLFMGQCMTCTIGWWRMIHDPRGHSLCLTRLARY